MSSDGGEIPVDPVPDAENWVDEILRDLTTEEIPSLHPSAPRKLEHGYNFYRLMYERSYDDEHGNVIFDGYTTRVFNAHGKLSAPYYSQILGLLKDMGCVKQLRRGGGGGTSRWLLQKWPTLEDFDEVHVPGTSATSARAHRVGHDRVMDQQMVALNERVTRIEDHLGLNA